MASVLVSAPRVAASKYGSRTSRRASFMAWSCSLSLSARICSRMTSSATFGVAYFFFGRSTKISQRVRPARNKMQAEIMCSFMVDNPFFPGECAPIVSGKSMVSILGLHSWEF